MLICSLTPVAFANGAGVLLNACCFANALVASANAGCFFLTDENNAVITGSRGGLKLSSVGYASDVSPTFGVRSKR